MDHPWHFPAAGDLCPGCSARHFPFCPPPPLPPHPFPYDLEPPPPPPPQYPAPFHPTPPPPSPPPYQAPFHPPQQMWGPPDPGPHPYELPGREGPPKRMRVGEASPFDRYDAAPPPPPSLLGRPSVEGERLLSLVRDHGHPRLPASPPPSQWHGQRYRPDGFSYGGGAGYHSPYGRGADFANFDHAGRLPPPGPMHDSYNALDTGFLPVRGPHESYFNGDHRYHQFHPEAFPSAQPLPPLPPYADSGKPYDSRGWHPEAGAVPPPPEHPFPSHSDYHAMPPRPTANSSLFPVLSGSLATIALPPSAQTFHQAHPMADTNCYDGQSNNKGPGSIYRPQSEKNLVDGGAISVHHSLDHSKVTIINACDLFKQPLRASRPDHIVIILRGLPGSGKSYIAKALRDLEVENGASAPRIHSMDDYFMIEVEKKIEDNEGSKSSSSSKGRRQLTKKVIEYCYEPEMEETYRSSMLNAFKKTLDEGNFTFVIVDDRNLRVADFAQFWAIAKKSGYEVYLLEAPYKDPTGCAARNVHGFTLDDIKKMAADWEEAPPLYLRLDIHSLFHDDNLHGHSIQEVDMDTEDVDDTNDAATNTSVEDSKKTIQEPLHEDEGLLKPGEKWNDEEDLNGFKELGQSKWSKYFEEDTEKSENAEKNKHALSGLAQTYGTHRKSVSWGDRLEKGGFSIAATKRKPSSSLIIGPGSGYNLVSNPLVEDFTGTKGRTNNETKKRFNEQLRDEGESFRAVFDKRKQRIGVFEAADDD